MGDATLFTRSDEVEEAWRFTDRIIAAWQAQGLQKLPIYPAGTWGPRGIDEFMSRDGRMWFQ